MHFVFALKKRFEFRCKIVKFVVHQNSNAVQSTNVIFHFVLFNLIIAHISPGQHGETIRSDRPGRSNSAYTAGKKILQIQTGLEFGASNYSGDARWNRFIFPVHFRYGITDKVEINAGIGHRSETLKADGEQLDKYSGIDMANLALRFNIFEETDKIPALGFEATYKSKLVSEDYRPGYSSSRLNLMASKGVSDNLGITANLGVDFNGYGVAPDGFYTINLGLVVDEHVSIFIENYSIFDGDYFDSFFNLGGSYLLSNDLQLDLFGGFGYNDDVFDWFISPGVSYRITQWR